MIPHQVRVKSTEKAEIAERVQRCHVVLLFKITLVKLLKTNLKCCNRGALYFTYPPSKSSYKEHD